MNEAYKLSSSHESRQQFDLLRDRLQLLVDHLEWCGGNAHARYVSTGHTFCTVSPLGNSLGIFRFINALWSFWTYMNPERLKHFSRALLILFPKLKCLLSVLN